MRASPFVLLALSAAIVLFASGTQFHTVQSQASSLATFGSQVVYTNDFEGVVGPEWSKTTTDVTPIGARRFLGQFSNEVVTLTLVNLPPHESVAVSFDLFVINSWDGNTTTVGPDIWALSLPGGPSLLHTTFSNVDELGFRQAYPDSYPGGDHPAHTGATEIDTLGYSNYGNSVYRLSFIFPHSASSLAIDFSGSGLQTLSDESWGLDNVEVRVGGSIPPTPTLTPTSSPTPTPQAAITTPIVFVIATLFSTPTVDLQEKTERLIALLKEASMYHGYANRTARPYIEFRIFGDNVIQDPEIPPMGPNGYYSYAAIYDKYNLCSLIQAHQVDEVWHWDDGGREFTEWVTTGPEWSWTWGTDAPNCGRQITTMSFNWNRDLDVAMEVYHHRLEGLFMNYFPCEFWTDTWPWTGWPSQCAGLVSDRFGYVARPFAGNNNIGVCGDAHHPPNILDLYGHSYDYRDPTTVQSICEDWQQDGTATIKSFNCQEWGCNQTQYHIWWMQNLPGLGNTNRDRNGRPQPNWWAYLLGRPATTPTPTSTPTHTATATATSTPVLMYVYLPLTLR